MSISFVSNIILSLTPPRKAEVTALEKKIIDFHRRFSTKSKWKVTTCWFIPRLSFYVFKIAAICAKYIQFYLPIPCRHFVPWASYAAQISYKGCTNKIYITRNVLNTSTRCSRYKSLHEVTGPIQEFDYCHTHSIIALPLIPTLQLLVFLL